MSTVFLIKGLFTGIMSLTFSWVVFSRYDTETDSDGIGEDGPKYGPMIHGALLPSFLLSVFLLGLKFLGPERIVKMTLTMCFAIFLHVSLYYAVLILALPFLRKRISARACAMLWLLPNYLYLTQQSNMELSRPLITIHTSSKLIEILFAVWLLGFASFFIWKVASHLFFRRKLLKYAVPVTDEEVLKVFRAEIEKTMPENPKFRLVMTGDISAPLTIGLFRRSTRIILPEKDYSPEELRLIFRHELIHICRADSWTKFFMMFCTAMCWFNPLMWLAMRKSAEDMELSCDETVLLEADEETRHRYANLILNAAGDDRGFSTCLSASISSMRYRLKSVVKPGKRRTGALIVGLTFFLLCMSCGYVSLAYGEDTGAATVFRGHDLSEFVADTITVEGGEYTNKIDNVDAEALTDYIAGLHTQEMTGSYSYSYSDDEKYLSIWYYSPYGVVLTDLHTDFIKVMYLSDDNSGWNVYYLPEAADWDYLDSIVPPLPEADVNLSDGGQYGGNHLKATVTKLVRKQEEQSVILKDREVNPHENSGIFGYTIYTETEVSFSMPLLSEAEVLIENWDYSYSYTVTPEITEGTAEKTPAKTAVKTEGAGDSITFDMPDYPAHYTIRASFPGNDGIYDAEFVFHAGTPDSM